MPSIASHFAVAKNVGLILNIYSNDFMIGNILPDIINLNNSHFKIKGKYYLIPDINAFLNNQNYDKDLLIGYLTHLLLDKYFLEEYIPNNISNYNKFNLFAPNCIYEDYSKINYSLIKDYNLNCKYISYIILNNKFDLDKDKVIRNIRNLNKTRIEKTKYINYDDFKQFLNDTSILIYKDIEKILTKKNKN